MKDISVLEILVHLIFFTVGENDGSYRGQRYFSSLPKHGIFIKGHDILCVTERRYKVSVHSVICSQVQAAPLIYHAAYSCC